MKKYIVTGGAGFIGSNLTARLLKDGAKVYVIDDLSTGFKRNVPRGAEFFKADISNFRELKDLDIPGNIDAVFHLAAQTSGEASFDDPARDVEVNHKGTYNVLKLAQAKGCGKFIYTSSMSVYGEVKKTSGKVSEGDECRPVSYYGCNKLASEKLIEVFAKNTGMKTVVLRLFNVYGPGQNMLNMKQGMVSIYMSYLLNSRPVHVKGGLDRFRDIVYIDDVIDALMLCESNRKLCGEILNIGTGRRTTVRRLLEVMLKAYGRKDFPAWVRCSGNTPGDVKGCFADTKKTVRLLGWEPKYDLKEGVCRMKTWAEGTIRWWQR
ncbi:MAG: NAD-dependent epimerase/dehydratase family protein [Candidatus Omnitrophota bacterium]